MNEKSNPMPMMYKTIPAVAELNKVPGFDPLKFLRHKVSRKTNEEMLQLELPYQKLWFRLRHPQGRMKLTTLRITEQLAIMEARVYLDRSDAEPISSYISQHSADEDTGICASSVSLTKEASRRKNGPLVGIMLSEPSRSYKASYSVSPLPDTRRPRVSSRFVQSSQERSVQ